MGYGGYMLSKNIEGSIIKQRNPKKRKVLLSLAAIITLMILFSGPGCGNQWILFYDKPLKGYVVDAETKQPIDGVIVVAMWRLSQFLSQGFGGYAKVIEVKTDKEGNFKIPFWITFKPWKFNSAMHDLAPEIVIYKPGYKVYSSHKLMRAGFPEDIVMTPEEKRKIKEEYSFNPARLRKIYTDEEIWENHMEFRSGTDYPAYFSKKQLRDIFYVIEVAVSELPIINNGAKKKITKDIKEDREYWLEGKR